MQPRTREVAKATVLVFGFFALFTYWIHQTLSLRDKPSPAIRTCDCVCDAQ